MTIQGKAHTHIIGGTGKLKNIRGVLRSGLNVTGREAGTPCRFQFSRAMI